MGILMQLPKEANTLYFHFDTAYWAIENVSFGSQGGDGSVMVSFLFTAYPNRDAKQKTASLEQVQQFSMFGGPISTMYEAQLYRWAGLFRASDIFAHGIPTSFTEQLAILYPFVKTYLNLADATDVLEESL
jgi:hypothetical protein